MTCDVVTASERPDLHDEAAAAFRQRWPEFIFHDPVPPLYMERVGRYFADLDVFLLDEGRVVAGVSFPTSGSYAVPDALNLLEVDRERDVATYREENLWVPHR